jgi:hypothetical protein
VVQDKQQDEERLTQQQRQLQQEEQDQRQQPSAKKQRGGQGPGVSPPPAKPGKLPISLGVGRLLEKAPITPADLAALPGGESLRAGDLRRLCDFLNAYRDLMAAKERHAAVVALLVLCRTQGQFQEVGGMGICGEGSSACQLCLQPVGYILALAPHAWHGTYIEAFNGVIV